MENFIVSARKYRPATFDTVVGQSAITNTLKNAIKSKHLAQAFLFCGPRGVGKTTCARILAKTINCFNLTENIEACDKCESCISFNQGHSLNVYELDAASNNSVDDIRALVDQVRLAPQLGDYKIYIIDEVHMLSTSAFNAFLKTLEEPPKHAIFILATTEKHKIIPTILSRCQIFDFSRIKIEDIAQHLAQIATKENIVAEPDGLHVIAQKADGGLRDALSMFDRIVTFTGNNITYKAVIENLNILDYDYYFKITDAVLTSNISQCLLILNEILDHGFDGNNFIVGLGEHFRNLLVCKDVATINLLEVAANIKEKYKQQSQASHQAFLIQALTIANKCDLNYKASKNQRLLLELTLIQLCSIGKNLSGDGEKKNDTLIASPKHAAAIQANAQVAARPVSSTNKPIQQVTTKTTVINGAAGMPVIEIEKGVPIPSKKPIVFNTPSIKDLTGQKPSMNIVAEEATENYAAIGSSLAKNEFTIEELMSVWEEYAIRAKEQKKSNLYGTLTDQKPVIKENYLIELPVTSKSQSSELEAERVELTAFLRQKLNNYYIKLTTVINQNESEKILYSPSEKYTRLLEKNPVLGKLRQRFDLDLDF
jgi:DNA polymerase-3 subunit gamma/tau